MRTLRSRSRAPGTWPEARGGGDNHFCHFIGKRARRLRGDGVQRAGCGALLGILLAAARLTRNGPPTKAQVAAEARAVVAATCARESFAYAPAHAVGCLAQSLQGAHFRASPARLLLARPWYRLPLVTLAPLRRPLHTPPAAPWHVVCPRSDQKAALRSSLSASCPRSVATHTRLPPLQDTDLVRRRDFRWCP